MNFVVFLGDGMADFPVPELGNRTPLQVADKPNMDRIAHQGRCGTLVTVEDDMPPGSEVANLTVLGYDPHQVYQGRGVIEAASMGVKLEDTDIGMRCNLICIEDGLIKNHSAGHISTEEAAELVEFLNQQLGTDNASFHPGISYRHLLVLKQGSPEIECAPPHDHVGERAEDLLVRPRNDEAKPTAELLNSMIRKSWELLDQHPVNRKRREQGKDPGNSMWVWSPGRKPKMTTFKESYGITGAVISAVDLIKGIGIYAGLDVIEVEGATGLINTNYEGKADACLEALRDHDFVYLHVEAPDEAGHARDAKQKVQSIEYLDSRLIARVMKGIEDRSIEARVAVLPDHATPVSKGNHIRGPVPVAIMGPGFEPDPVKVFDEESVLAGALGEWNRGAWVPMHGDRFLRTLLG
ncbi:MAG: cofactor-independent phosphoglycerate mutase [candidate division WOR-3 bacterium]|nr:MAG: cofactor-independent phosphoglycerate mutase [candidate division WOR-3 bacterium]